MNISTVVISCAVNILYVLVIQLIMWSVKTDWKFLPYLSELLYTCRGLVEKSEEKKTLLKIIPVTILGALLAISNNILSVGVLSFM
jgi:Na+/glutamate symporter